MTDVQYIKGIGPVKAKLLANVGIEDVSALLHYYPRVYEDRRLNAPLGEFRQAYEISGPMSVLSAHVLPTRSLLIFKAMLEDDKKEIYEATWFKKRSFRFDAMAQLKKDFKVGAKFWIIGKREDKNSFTSRRITVEEYYPFDSPDLYINANAIVPIYPLTQGLSNKFFRLAVHNALQKYLCEQSDPLPRILMEKRKLLSLRQALKAIHFPSSFTELEHARRRMVYEEFLLMTMAWGIKQKQGRKVVKPHKYEIKRTLLTPFRNNLGFDFTPAQTRVINEIFKDMLSHFPMTRMLQGDVGSGKTVAALSAILLAVENNYQAAFMAPTEILAAQHFITMQKFLRGLEVKTVLLTSKTPKKEKEKILSEIAAGAVDVVVGTHSLIEDNVLFKNLKLIVIDEQHRFGVKQRAALRAKAAYTDMLSMTATPIPRTFAMAFYGDLDVSTIDALPPGRKEIKTTLEDEEAAVKVIEGELALGRQAYVVYPLIDESDKLSLKSVTKEFERLKTLLPAYKIAMIHGAMKSKEKQKIMEAFANGKIDVLAATPVIEVGIDVKNATVMVVQNAERFGLASLHQLRGRIGRGEVPSQCVLVPSKQTGAAGRKRLDIICGCSDGFKIGEQDLALRGPGEILGTRQSGELEFKTGDILRDREVLRWAVEDRNFLLQTDENLKKPENAAFKRRLITLYEKQWNIIDLG